MMKKVALIGGLLALVGAGSAFGAGQFPGYPLASSISGFEYVPADTGDVATRATFTGAISGNTLTVTPPTGALVIQGALGVGQNLRGANLAPGTVITGGAGGSTTSQTWTISPAQTVTSTQMTSGGGGVNPQTAMIQMQQLKAYMDTSPIVTGNLNVAENLPAASTCGTSPAISAGSSSNGGAFTTGTGTPTACTITFATAFATTAACTITPANAASGAITAYVSAQSKTAFTVTLSAGTNSAKYAYTCVGN